MVGRPRTPVPSSWCLGADRQIRRGHQLGHIAYLTVETESRIAAAHYSYLLTVGIGYSNHHVGLKNRATQRHDRLTRFQRFTGGIHSAKEDQDATHPPVALPHSLGDSVEFGTEQCVSGAAEQATVWGDQIRIACFALSVQVVIEQNSATVRPIGQIVNDEQCANVLSQLFLPATVRA